MANHARDMQTAIEAAAAALETRGLDADALQDGYRRVDWEYRQTVNHKTYTGSVDLYIRREGYALAYRRKTGREVKSDA